MRCPFDELHCRQLREMSRENVLDTIAALPSMGEIDPTTTQYLPTQVS